MDLVREPVEGLSSPDDSPAPEQSESPWEAPPEPIVTELSTQSDVIEEDVTHFNFLLRRLQRQWKFPLDTEDTCKLVATTMKLLELRRKMMLLPTEAPKDDGKSNGFGKGGYFGAFADSRN